MSSRAQRRRLDSAPQRIVSVGLAAATAVGIVGALAVRTAQDSAAAEIETDIAQAPVTTSDGLTQADLDAYAAMLEAERQRLQAYRDQLVEVAAALGAQPATAQSTQASVSARTKPAPKAKAAPRVKPAPRPQAQSQGS